VGAAPIKTDVEMEVESDGRSDQPSVSIIDDLYIVEKQFQDKPVFKVYRKDNFKRIILKLYPPTTKALNDFFWEVKRNGNLKSHPRVLRATRFEGPRMGMAPFTFSGVMYAQYGYLLVPYCKNGTLLDLMNNVILKRTKLSIELVKYLVR
jgi:hypothetical protein